MDPLVTPAWLAAHQAEVRIVDLRWYLGGKSAAAEYAKGHIPGAVFLDLGRDLSGAPTRGPGRHPLPTPAQMEAAMAKAGIGAGTDVVAYDDASSSIAARLWYLLRLFGHQAGAAVLDGGLPAWLAEGLPVVALTPEGAAAHTPAGQRYPGGLTQPPTPPFRADPSRLATWILDRAAVATSRSDPATLLLDARAAERYRGDLEPIDARPGHIPGARSAPWSGNVEAGRFRTPVALRERFAALGADQAARVVAYCGSGVTACHDLLALHLAGYPDDRLRLYQGSWSEWARDPSLTAVTGDKPE